MLFAGSGLIALIFFGISAGKRITGKKGHQPVAFTKDWNLMMAILVAVIARAASLLSGLILK